MYRWSIEEVTAMQIDIDIAQQKEAALASVAATWAAATAAERGLSLADQEAARAYAQLARAMRIATREITRAAFGGKDV